MTPARDTAMQKLEAKLLQQILGRPTRKHVNKMRGAIAAVYAKAKTYHESSPLESKFGFSAAILKKDKYNSLNNMVATGRFTVTSRCRFKYIMVAYDHDSNTIHAEPMKNCSAQSS